MGLLRRATWIMFVVVSSLANVWGPADTKLTEYRFGATDRAPSGDIVFVDIDSRSIADVGQWPWPRSIHGQLLDRLMEWGASDVAFDIDFSTPSSPQEDAAFAESLERAGGYAFLAAFRQGSASGQDAFNIPIPALAEHARPVLVNVNELEGGQVRSIPSTSPLLGAQSIAVQFSGRPPDAETIRIDYGIDLTQVVRIPASDVLAGTADPALVRDRQVVVGASAIEFHDLFNVPRFGVIAGPLVQIAAAETVKQGRNLLPAGIWPGLVLAALLLLTWPRRLALRTTVLSMAALMLVAEAGALAALWMFRLDLASMPFHIGCLCVIVFKFMADRAHKRQQIGEKNQQLAYLAMHDDRTGALSRTAFVALVEQRASAGAVNTIVLVRIDRFDLVEASLGHDVCEAALSQLYARLNAVANGKVGRLESDIFALVIDGAADQAQIEPVVWRLGMPYIVDEHRLVLNTCWGAAQTATGYPVGDVIQQARMALAVARERDVTGLTYATHYSDRLKYRQAIDIAVRHAQAQGEMDVVFQSQVEIATRRLVGAEALLRWNSREYGQVSPTDFIPLAEDNGTIVQLGGWVMLEACRQAVELGWTGRLSVNVSPVQFQHGDVVAMIRSALETTGFPPSRLDIEVTESALDHGLIASLDALRKMGVKIAIDDFGTGYSTLSRLASIPVDKLKIDQSFVRAMTDQKSEGVIEAIVSLAARLGQQVVVEGVETDEELATLSAMGCTIAQGYLFGRPSRLADLLAAPLSSPIGH